MSNFNTLLSETSIARFFSNPIDFGLWLAGLRGHQFMSFYAIYDMDGDGKMNKNKRGTRGKNTIPNPYLGKGLCKVSHTEVTCCFDYESKVERRGGDEPIEKGNWMQAVIVNGKITPLSTHKGDIVVDNTELPIAEQKAILDSNGTVQFNTDNPRLYLRYEIVRDSGNGERSERRMRCESKFVFADGTEIDKKELEDYLPPVQPRKDETDVQCTSLANIVELKAAGEIWRKRTVPVPVLPKQTVKV